MERPPLTSQLNCELFMQFYFLKEELMAFCKVHSLDYNDGKTDITKRIYHFLKTGDRLPANVMNVKKIKANKTEINIDKYVEHPFVCSEAHREFFSSFIGKQFKFNVAFQKYMKADTKKTYAQAVDKWYELDELKKKNKGKSAICKQFEYNTYIRDFFCDNKGYTLQQAIKCWKYKKSMPGHNKYENIDLQVLENGY